MVEDDFFLLNVFWSYGIMFDTLASDSFSLVLNLVEGLPVLDMWYKLRAMSGVSLMGVVSRDNAFFLELLGDNLTETGLFRAV